MKVVITGATGFLGQELIGSLVQTGAEVYAVCRDTGKLRAGLRNRCVPVEIQLSEYAALPELIADADIFIHLAWDGTGHERRNNPTVQQQNVEYSKIAMLSAHRMGCRLFIMAGSQAEYGITSEPQKEEMTCEPFSEYGKAKLQVWRECLDLAEELGMKYIHLRIFSLIGEHDKSWTLMMTGLYKMMHNEPLELSSCEQNWNYLYVKDAASQIMRLCHYADANNTCHSEIFNIASNDSRKLKRYLERMVELTNSQSELRYGAVASGPTISLQPDMTKLVHAIGMPIENYTFEEAVAQIVSNLKWND